MARWECYRCSYVVETENPPDECPSCNYSVSFWISQPQERKLTLKDFVRRNLLKLDGDESVSQAAKLMREHDTENVLVTIDGELAGMVTERDILTKVAAEDLLASQVPLRKVMTSLVTAPSETPVTDALKMMAARHIRRLIVTEGGHPIGVVSHRSILGEASALPERAPRRPTDLASMEAAARPSQRPTERSSEESRPGLALPDGFATVALRTVDFPRHFLQTQSSALFRISTKVRPSTRTDEHQQSAVPEHSKRTPHTPQVTVLGKTAFLVQVRSKAL